MAAAAWDLTPGAARVGIGVLMWPLILIILGGRRTNRRASEL